MTIAIATNCVPSMYGNVFSNENAAVVPSLYPCIHLSLTRKVQNQLAKANSKLMADMSFQCTKYTPVCAGIFIYLFIYKMVLWLYGIDELYN